jgi:hypothetical protein
MHCRSVSHRLFLRVRTALLAGLTAIFVTVSPLTADAQATATASAPPPELSRFDLYGGYGYINPGNSAIGPNVYQPINQGAVVSAATYFNSYLGVQVEGSFFPNGPNDCINTVQAGPILRYQKGRFVPFLHVLGGGAKVGGPVFQPCTWGWGATGGLGLDFILPAFHNHLAIRPIQADYDYSHVDYGPVDVGNVVGGIGVIHAYKLSAGLVLRLGQVNPPPAVQLGCTAEPSNIFPGDPITVTGSTGNLRPGKKTTYYWTTTGGKITGTGETITVDTSGLAPGDYTVVGHVIQSVRPSEQAGCTAGFRVHAWEPPAINCSATPSSVLSGDPVTITAVGRSPQNRPLSYSYSASLGQVSGSTPTVTLSTADAPPGVITVTCNAVDDIGQQATAIATVTISVPPPPPPPPPVPLCTVTFDRDKKRPVRVDNEGKGCLDEVALTLNRDSSSRLVIVGRHTADESSDSAAERALNVEEYLVREKGIDPSRLELRTRGESGKAVENTLVPAGASFTPGDTSTFDSTIVKRHGQPYGVAEPVARPTAKPHKSQPKAAPKPAQ